ncbi:MAG: hypothetical protein LBB24_03725, partial [Rickettsiales bacterium]|nr:hypothetical protein [Rickettsiales bacterium]
MLTSEVILNIFVNLIRNGEVHNMILRSALYATVAYALAKTIGYIFDKLRGEVEDSQRTAVVAIFLAIRGPLLLYIWVVCLYDIVE